MPEDETEGDEKKELLVQIHKPFAVFCFHEQGDGRFASTTKWNTTTGRVVPTSLTTYTSLRPSIPSNEFQDSSSCKHVGENRFAFRSEPLCLD